MPNRPLAEPHGDIASDSHANGKNHVKVVVRKLAFDAPRTLLSNLQKLFASCLAHKFTVTVDLVDMVGDILTTCLKQLLYLLSRQPDVLTLEPNIDVRDAIVVLIDQKYVRVTHVSLQDYLFSALSAFSAGDISPASPAARVFPSRRGAERQRAQRLIGVIDEFLPAEVDRQSKREIHGDKMRLEMSPALSFPVVVSIFLSALSASPRLCVRSPS